MARRAGSRPFASFGYQARVLSSHMHARPNSGASEHSEACDEGCGARPRCCRVRGTAAQHADIWQASVVGQRGRAAEAQSSRGRPDLDRDGDDYVDYGYVGLSRAGRVHRWGGRSYRGLQRRRRSRGRGENQAGVARGGDGIDDVAQVHRYIDERLAEHGAHVDMYLYCPYHPEGMVEESPARARTASLALGWRRLRRLAQLNLAASLVVGDRLEDVGLAEAVGATAIYLGASDIDRPGVWSFPSLAAAAPFILERIAV